MFTQRHFAATAEALRRTRPSDTGWHTSADYRQWRADVESLALLFKAHNERFDRQRFFAACERNR